MMEDELRENDPEGVVLGDAALGEVLDVPLDDEDDADDVVAEVEEE